MKTKIRMAVIMIIITASFIANAQSQIRPKMAVISIDYKGEGGTPNLLGNYLRTEMVRIESYEIIDRYDQQFILKQQNINTDLCFGKLCLEELGKALKADKVMSGRSTATINQALSVN